MLFYGSRFTMLFLLDEPDYAHMVEDFEAIHDPSSYSTVHHEEGHSLQVTFQMDFLSWTKFRFQYLITSSGTTCWLSPIDPNWWNNILPVVSMSPFMVTFQESEITKLWYSTNGSFGIVTHHRTIWKHQRCGMAHEQRTRVRDGNTPIPNWAADSRRTWIHNKKELFSFTISQICKSGVSRTLLLNAHFFRKHISTPCLRTGIFMYQNFNRSSRPRKIPWYSFIYG